MFTLRDETTGAELATFDPADHSSPRAAQMAAALRAKRLALAGAIVLMTGPNIPERRYARPYALRYSSRPYRVRCAGCGVVWVHDRSTRDRCRACWSKEPERALVLARNRERRWPGVAAGE